MSENSESDDNEMQVFMFLVYMCTIGKSRDYIASATFGFFFSMSAKPNLYQCYIQHEKSKADTNAVLKLMKLKLKV